MKCEMLSLASLSKRIVSGGTPKSTCVAYYENGTIPWLNTKEVHFNRIKNTEKHITKLGLENSSAKWVEAPAIIVAMYGATAGNVAISEIPLTTNQACCNIVIDEDKADYRYVYYYLKFNYRHLSGLANGGAQQNLNAQQIKDFLVCLPSLNRQKQIAAILSAIDDKIETNKRINDNLEQQAMALVESVLASGEPTALGQLMSFENGFAFQSGTYQSSGTYRVITIKNVQDGRIDSTGAAYLTEIPSKMKPSCLLKPGDALLSLTGNVGRVGIVYEENLLLNQRVAKICALDSAWLPFLYFLFRLPSTKNTLESIAKGTAQQNLSPIETLKVEIPFDKTLVDDQSALLTKIYATILNNSQESLRLATMRDTLLPKLMSGEIDVENVKI